MQSKTSHDIKHRLVPNDEFFTPVPLAKELISLVPLRSGDIVLDPAMGKGSFYNNFPDFVKKDYCEINKGRNFFKYSSFVDWCVTNPPYSKLDKWFKKSCEVSKKGFGYLIGLINLTARRIELCNQLNFFVTKLHLFKVFAWYGMSIFVVFEKNKSNIITYNRKVWKADSTPDEKKKTRTDFTFF